VQLTKYYKPSERSKATEQRNFYYILGIETIPSNNMSTYTATQVNTSNFNPPNVIPMADTLINPQNILPNQGMNVDTVLQQLCTTLQLPAINANNLTNLINQALGRGNPGGNSRGGGGYEGGGRPPSPPPLQAGGVNPPDLNAIFNGLMNTLCNMNEQEDIKQPDEFTGDPNKAQDFIHQRKMYFLAKPQKFQSDGAKIRFTNFFMKDEGKHCPKFWAITQEKAYIVNRWPTWDKHKKAFLTVYQTADPAASALVKLHTIKQGKGNVINYIIEFNRFCT
jgi:predicted DNA-binding WGR domain protein